MTKRTITRTWIGGTVVLAGGLLAAIIGLCLMLAYGEHFTPALNGNGYDFHPTLNPFFWGTLSLTCVGAITAAIAG